MNTLHRRMIKDICKQYGVEYQDIFSKHRKSELVNAKKIIYWILRNSGLSYKQIARMLKKDHTTIINGVETITSELKNEAVKIYKRYKKAEVLEAIEKQKEITSYKRKKIVDLLNQGETLKIISDAIGEPINYVENEINNNITTKKIPNYITGQWVIKYFEKNKKNY